MKYKDMSGYENVKDFGPFNNISPDFIYGENLNVGNFNVILHNVKVGNNVDIQHHTLIKPGTVIGNDCYVDSYVLTSGDCQIGNNAIINGSVICESAVDWHNGALNGAERMLNNKDIGSRLLNINLNNHSKDHICRAALEGIAFSFVYGMEIPN